MKSSQRGVTPKFIVADFTFPPLVRRDPRINKPVAQPCAQHGDAKSQHQAEQGGEPVAGQRAEERNALTGPMKAAT
jgi:hypothetical protein